VSFPFPWGQSYQRLTLGSYETATTLALPSPSIQLLSQTDPAPAIVEVLKVRMAQLANGRKDRESALIVRTTPVFHMISSTLRPSSETDAEDQSFPVVVLTKP
jgi:hypothetical protein